MNSTIPSILENNKPRLDTETMKKCRICLNASGINHPLDRTLPKSTVTLHTALIETFDIKLKNNWNFPTTICSRCYNLTVSSYLFKQEIIKNEIQLEEMMNCESIKKSNFVVKKESEIEICNQKIFAEPFDHENGGFINEIKQEPFDVQYTPSSKEEDLKDSNTSDSFDLNQTVPRDKRRKRSNSKSSNKEKKCLKCGFLATRVIGLWHHIETSERKCSDFYDPPHKCYICDMKFMIKSSLNRHFKNDHADYVMKDCPYCVRGSMKTALNYNTHVRTHFEAPNHICPHCGKGFFRLTDFNVHMKIYDESYFVYCDLCEYKCKSKHSLKNHLHQHLKIGSYVCRLCSKTFIKSSRLTEHLFRNHQTTNNKSCYRCVDCDFVFMSRRDHQRHKLHCSNPKNPLSLRRVKYKDLDPNVLVRDVLRDESTKDI